MPGVLTTSSSAWLARVRRGCDRAADRTASVRRRVGSASLQQNVQRVGDPGYPGTYER